MVSDTDFPQDERIQKRGGHTPRAISLGEAAEIANRVHDLIRAGRENHALALLGNLHPADMGSIVASLPRNSRDTMIRVMSPDTVVWMLRQMNPIEAKRVGTRLGSQMLSLVARQLHPTQVLGILDLIPHPRRREVAQSLEEPLPVDVIPTASPDTAKALKETIFPTVDSGGTVSTAREKLDSLGEIREKLTYIYVIDQTQQIVGQISMVQLAMADNATVVDDLATTVLATVSDETPTTECARLQRHYNLTQLPVIEGSQLTGVILADALLGATVEHDTHQMQQVANVAGETIDGPLAGSISTRLPWLTINLATTFVAAATISFFESTLAQAVALAAFLPVVAGQGGIGGTQTLTLIVRAIALGELAGVDARRLLSREAALGLLHGVWLGLLVGIIAILWKQNFWLGVVLGVAMLGNMIIAGLVGAGVPLFLRRVGQDPAVASAVLVTTATDVLGFLLFLGLASAAISLIV